MTHNPCETRHKEWIRWAAHAMNDVPPERDEIVFICPRCGSLYFFNKHRPVADGLMETIDKRIIWKAGEDLHD